MNNLVDSHFYVWRFYLFIGKQLKNVLQNKKVLVWPFDVAARLDLLEKLYIIPIQGTEGQDILASAAFIWPFFFKTVSSECESAILSRWSSPVYSSLIQSVPTPTVLGVQLLTQWWQNRSPKLLVTAFASSITFKPHSMQLIIYNIMVCICVSVCRWLNE